MGTLVGKSIVNVTSEMIITVLAALTAAGGVLTGAVAKMWLFFRGELSQCQQDRTELYAKTDEMHAQITEISKQVGRLEGRMERNEER